VGRIAVAPLMFGDFATSLAAHLPDGFARHPNPKPPSSILDKAREDTDLGGYAPGAIIRILLAD
jgi:hypothetical protein